MLISALLSAVLALPPQRGCTAQLAPLHTGSHSAVSSLPFWRKEDAGTWGGTGWLGWTRKSSVLVPVTLAVRDLPNARGDDDDRVTVEKSADVTWAVRCVAGLSPGTIRSADVVNAGLAAERPLRVMLGARQYDVRLRSRRDDRADATVTLSDGRRTQVLYSTGGFADDPHFEIVWAGDLDRDGRLDLLVDLSRKYSVHPYRLWLSSKASPGQLVGEAAVFEILAE